MAYVLVFWDDRPSTSIVHKSKVIGGVVVDAKRTIVWGKQQLPAKIIRAGTMPALKDVVVTIHGQVNDPARGPQGAAARRRREVLDERQRAAVQHRSAAEAARLHFLYHMTDEAAAANGPAAAAPVVGIQFLFDRGASAEDMLKSIPVPLSKANVRALLDNLPCLREPPADDTKMINIGGDLYTAYLDKRAVWSVTKTHLCDPDTLFRELVLLCVPATALALPFVSAGGTKGTVGVSRNIWKGAARGNQAFQVPVQAAPVYAQDHEAPGHAQNHAAPVHAQGQAAPVYAHGQVLQGALGRAAHVHGAPLNGELVQVAHAPQASAPQPPPPGTDTLPAPMDTLWNNGAYLGALNALQN